MITLTLIAATTLACSDEGADASAPAATVRDSAGIAIVQNPDPGDRTGVIAMEPTPRLAIGVLEGAPEYQLYEVSDAAVLSDGRIAIANSGSHEVRYYTPDGEYLSSTGGEGDGPGEFRELSSLERLPGDSLLVYDWRNRRLSLLDPEGGFVRSSALAASDAFPFPVGLIDPNTMLVRLNRMFSSGDDEIRQGVQRDSAVYTAFQWRSPDEDSLTAELRVPGPARFMSQGEGWMMLRGLLLAPEPSLEAGNGRLYLGLADSYEIRVMDRDGTVRRIIRRAHTPVPVTSDMWDAAVEATLENTEDEEWKKREREALSGMPVAEVLPAHGDIAVDAAGRVWVQRYESDPDAASAWDVYDERGEWLAALTMPERFRVLELGDDYVLGLQRDELDVEQVQMYGLTLPEPVQG